MKKLMISIFAIVLVQSFALSSEYYVSTDGNDSANGDIGTPWLTIQRGMDVIVSGDTLHVRGGIYNIVNGLKFANSGINGSPITLRGYQDEIAIIDGNYDETNTEYALIAIEKRYINISHLTVRNATKVGIHLGGGSVDNINLSYIATIHTRYCGIQAANTSDINVTYCDISEHTEWGMDEGLTFYNVQGGEIAHNKVHHSGNTGLFNAVPPESGTHSNGIGIDVKGSSNNIDIHHNEVYENQTNGIYVDCDVLGSVNINIFNNESYDNGWGTDIGKPGGHGFSVSDESGDSTETIQYFNIYNNLSYRNSYTGFNFGYSNSGHKFNDFQVVNNVAFDNGTDGFKFTTHINSTNIFVSNNISRNNGDGSATFDMRSEDNNDYGLIIDTNNVSSLTGLPSSGLHYVTADPLFLDVTNGNFNLSSGSPAIDAGLTSVLVYEPTTDYNSNTRVVNGAIDIGAFEAILSVSATGKTSIRSGFSLDMLTDFLGD